MSIVNITPTKIDKDGESESFQAMSTADQYKVRNDGRMLLHFKKTGAGAANITVVTPKEIKGYAIADQIVVVPATTGDVMMAPVDRDLFSDAAQDVNFTTDEDTGLTVAAVRI